MLIVCPNCATSYRVETAALGEAGRSVRCVRCRNVWLAGDPPVLSSMAQVQCTEAQCTALEPVSQSACEPDFYPSQPPVMPPESITVDAWGKKTDASSVRGARRQARRGSRSSLPSLPIAFVVLVAIHGALIGWRADVVKVAPQTAPFYSAIGLPVNLRGLTFANVTTVSQMHDGVPVLVVEGAIASASASSVEVPRLRLSIHNSSGQEIYAWTELPERSVLAPGEILAFRSRLASPPSDAGDVVVRFLNRNDLMTGVQHAAAEKGA
jgi:predicted Zn finger-like uncharacterized protein